MNVFDVIMTRRTIRKFKQQPIDRDLLVKMIDVGRMAPTGGNSQPLSFGIATEKELCNRIFQFTGWARHLKSGGPYTPSETERPTAYILVFSDEENKVPAETAASAAIENILILAHAEGLGCCWLGSVNREKIMEILGDLGNKCLIYVVALGYPAESPVIVPFRSDLPYYIDDHKVFSVPKKNFRDVVIIDR